MFSTFNQLEHLATVIAFALPINDIILANMALSRFLLKPSNINLDNSAIPAGNALNAYLTMASNRVKFSVWLPNTALKMVYCILAFNLANDL